MNRKLIHDRELIEEALASVRRLGIDDQIEQWGPKINGVHADVVLDFQIKGKRSDIQLKRSVVYGLAHWERLFSRFNAQGIIRY